jgi:hypothetical protein
MYLRFSGAYYVPLALLLLEGDGQIYFVIIIIYSVFVIILQHT